MDLIIVESPTKAKTLSRFLGDRYDIEASMGHVRDLPQSRLGVDVASDFAPEYVVPAKKKEIVSELKKAASKAGSIILATDPDREGEAIAYHLSELIDGKSKGDRIARITFHEITESAISEALSNPGTINMQLVDSQQARRVLDRLVGYKLSPLLWRKVRKGLSAGRVQSVAVRLIVEREREIKAFVPVEYWEIQAKLKRGDGEFEAKLMKVEDKAVEIKSESEADGIVAKLLKEKYQVADIQTKEVSRSPYPPFTTSTLQQAAANLFGWSARRTMQVAQNLYEHGKITYHRTDSLNLAQEAVAAARNYIKEHFSDKYLPEAPRFYRTKSKVAQEAHEAIRPTAVGSYQQTANNNQLDRDQTRLYELIWKRFMACQLADAIFEQKGVDITAGKYLFRANGNKQLFDGWLGLYQKNERQETSVERQGRSLENGDGKTTELPELTVGEVLELLELLPSQHFTEPPPRFTEASLIKALEEYGIGRPSTYAPIISTIQERQYVEKIDKKFQPTALGSAVNDFLVANFPSLLDYQFTAQMEDELDEIANGEKKWVPVIREFYDPFAQLLAKVSDTAERVKVEVETTDEKCPNDGSPLVVRIGRFGKFLACSKFPECKFTKPFQQKLNMKCPKCGVGEVVIKRTKSRKSFYGCSRYPECDFASWTKPKMETKGSEEAANVPLDS